MDVNRYRNMTIERFLNHLYYSYAGLNRTLFNDAPYVPNGVAQDSFAGLIFTFTLGRYTIAILYFVIICPMRLEVTGDSPLTSADTAFNTMKSR